VVRCSFSDITPAHGFPRWRLSRSRQTPFCARPKAFPVPVFFFSLVRGYLFFSMPAWSAVRVSVSSFSFGYAKALLFSYDAGRFPPYFPPFSEGTALLPFYWRNGYAKNKEIRETPFPLLSFAITDFSGYIFLMIAYMNREDHFPGNVEGSPLTECGWTRNLFLPLLEFYLLLFSSSRGASSAKTPLSPQYLLELQCGILSASHEPVLLYVDLMTRQESSFFPVFRLRFSPLEPIYAISFFFFPAEESLPAAAINDFSSHTLGVRILPWLETKLFRPGFPYSTVYDPQSASFPTFLLFGERRAILSPGARSVRRFRPPNFLFLLLFPQSESQPSSNSPFLVGNSRSQ